MGLIGSKCSAKFRRFSISATWLTSYDLR